MKIDAHQHFWTYDAAEYPWIPVGSALHRDWLPEDLARLLEAEGIGGCVAVQARQTLEETRWLLKLAKEAPIIRGVVGWVDLRSPEVESQLAEFAGHEEFVGVRHVVQDEPDAFMLTAEFQRGIAALHVCGDPGQFPMHRYYANGSPVPADKRYAVKPLENTPKRLLYGMMRAANPSGQWQWIRNENWKKANLEVENFKPSP